MQFLTRRDFLRHSAVVSAALAASPALPIQSMAADADADQRPLRVAVIGVRGRGRDHVAGFAGKHHCQVTTICDCDEAVIGSAMMAAMKAQGKEPKYVKDLRRVIDDPAIDIISIATPNHWHALAAIWAMQAGKDVYVEKPVSHNFVEGVRMVEVAAKTGRLCQSGTQSRSDPAIREAVDYARNQIGAITLAHGICYKLRPSIGKVDSDQEPPATMDYDLWCGPARKKPPHRQTANGSVHYDWHWLWDYGNGDLGNQGIHQMDTARWGLGKTTLPERVRSVGGRLGYRDDGETPNSQLSKLAWEDAWILIEVRGLASKSPWPAAVKEQEKKGSNFIGNIFYGKEGTVVISNSGVAYALDSKGSVVKVFRGEGDHFANFVAAVRSRKRAMLNADIVEGHLSSALCHLANISYRLSKPRSIGQDSRGMGFGEDHKNWDILVDFMTHLLEDHKLAGQNWNLGASLWFDAAKGRFAGEMETEANALLSREYRKGFELPPA